MKKLLSVILAGALALTAVSPVMATTSDYVNAADYVYYNKDFTAYDASSDGTMAEYLSGDGTQVIWNSTAATIAADTDNIMGTVAKVTATGTDTAIEFESGFTQYSVDEFVAGTLAQKHFIFEVDFLDEGTGKWGPYFQEWHNGAYFGSFSNGTMTGRANLFSTTYKVGEWNNLVVDYTIGTSGSADFYLNGVKIGNNCHGANYPYTDDATWSANSGLRFEAGASVKLANIKKYQLIAAYDGTADVAPTITPDTSKVDMSVSYRTINYDANLITTAAELVAALPVATGESIVLVCDLQDGSGEFPLTTADDLTSIPVEYIKYYAAKSVSGAVVQLYTLAEKEDVNITFGTGLVVDTEARTILVTEDVTTTVEGLKALITVDGGTTYTVVGASSDDELADATALDDGMRVKAVSGPEGLVTHYYTISYKPNTEVFVDIDFKNYTEGTAPAFATAAGTVLNQRFATATVAMDAEMGHYVADFTPASNTWSGLDNVGADFDVALGEKVILETTVKPMTDCSAGTLTWQQGVPGGSGAGGHFMFHFNNGLLYTNSAAAGAISYTPGEWYHIVAENTPTESGNTVNIWINGVQVATNIARNNFTLSYWNTISNGKQMRYESTNAQQMMIKKIKISRSKTGYSAADEGDVAAITSTDNAVIVTEEKKTVTYSDATMTAADFAAKLSAGNGTVAFLNAEGAAVDMETGSITDVATILARSASTDLIVKYTPVYANVTSSKYDVSEGSITGVLSQTTPEAFYANVTVDGEYGVDYVLSTTTKYIEDGDVLITSAGDYTISLKGESHHTGANLDGEDGIHFGLKSSPIVSEIATDAVRGSDNSFMQFTGATDGSYWRLNFRAEDTSNNGSGYIALQRGEYRNIEFAVKTNSGTHWGLITDGTWTINGKGTVLARNQGMNEAYHLPVSYNLGDWMHVGVSLCWPETSSTLHQKVYIDGELVYEGGVSTASHTNSTGLWLASGLTEGEDFAIDDIKIYDSEIWGIDMEYRYGYGLASTSDDVVVANGDVWVANGAKVSDGITASAIDSTGAALDLSTVEAGGAFYVRTLPIIKKYTVKEGALGTTVAADGTLTAAVGMVDDDAAPAIFVAGWDGAKFTNIVKVVKTAKTDDTITYDLNNIGADTAKVYVWDASLTSLTGVATYTNTADGWVAN